MFCFIIISRRYVVSELFENFIREFFIRIRSDANFPRIFCGFFRQFRNHFNNRQERVMPEFQSFQHFFFGKFLRARFHH